MNNNMGYNSKSKRGQINKQSNSKKDGKEAMLYNYIEDMHASKNNNSNEKKSLKELGFKGYLKQTLTKKNTKNKRIKKLKRIGIGLALFLIITVVAISFYVFPKVTPIKQTISERLKEGFTHSTHSKIIVKDVNDVEIKNVFPSNDNITKNELGDKWDILVNSTIDVEDEDFYKHSGIDYTSLRGTITYKLTNNYIFQNDKNGLDIKVKNFIGAIELEKAIGKDKSKKETKDMILELYFNRIPYGYDTYGIKNAAKIYFNKNVSELSDAQIIYLSAIPIAPTTYCPFGQGDEINDENFVNEKTKKRMIGVVLSRMKKCGHLNDSEIEKIKSEIPSIEEEIKKNKQKSYQSLESNADYYVRSYLKESILEYFAKANGYEKPYKNKFKIIEEYTNSYRKYKDNLEQLLNDILTNNNGKDIIVKTSIDLNKQKELVDKVSNGINNYLQNSSKDYKERTILESKLKKQGSTLNDKEIEVLDKYIKETNLTTKRQAKNELSKKYPEGQFDSILASIKKKTGISQGDELTYDIQGSAVTIENDNDHAYVVAIVGGRKTIENKIFEGKNRALYEPHAPGTSFEPIVVYGPAFERKCIDDKPILPDTKLNYDKNLENVDEDMKKLNQKKVKLPYDPIPHNAKTIDINTSLAKSLNTVTFRLFYGLGKNYAKENGLKNAEIGACSLAWDYLEKTSLTGMGRFYEEEGRHTASGYSMSLGEGDNTRVTTLEMASMYSAIERDGRYYTPSCVKEVEGYDGKIPKDEPQQLFKTDTTHKLNKVMRNTFDNGICKDYKMKSDWDAVGQAGITNYSNNTWLCGYTKKYTTSVWVGYTTDSFEQDSANGFRLDRDVSGIIWRDIMDYIHEDQQYDPSKDRLNDEYDTTNVN